MNSPLHTRICDLFEIEVPIVLAGMELVTTEPAPMTLFSPIVTPLQTITLSPIQFTPRINIF